MITDDKRNVIDKYKGWELDLIKEDLNKNSLPFAVCMSQISGDFNFGSVVRSSNAFGAKEVFYYGKKHWDRRSACGSNHYSSVKFLASIEELKLLKEKYKFVGLENNISKTVDIRKFKWPTNSLILIGEENAGLTQEVIDLCDHVVEIPIMGSVRSFNAASASTVAMYDYVAKYKN